MSPEQLLAQRVHLDRRTDVWSLGVTLYECLTLQRPFDAPTREGLYQAIQSKEPPDPCSLNAAVPRTSAVVLETALDKDRDRRYQTALDLAEDLRRVREYEPIAAKPASAWIKLKRWAQRNPALAGSLSAGFLFLIVGLVVALSSSAAGRGAGQREGDQRVPRRTLAAYDQMSDVALVEDLKAQAARLWPRRPHMLPAMAEWLEKARELHGRLPLHEAALQELRDRAAPYDAAQQEADAETRREIHAELFDAIAAKKKEISEARGGRGPAPLSDRGDREGDRGGGATTASSAATRSGRSSSRASSRSFGGEIAGCGRSWRPWSKIPGSPERLTWKLSDPTDRWRHQVLSRDGPGARGFGALIEDVEQRQSFAETIEERSVEDHRAAWDRCLADLKTNPKYAASADLRTMKPQIGLVPLGIDRDSGLWEFWHVGSGERPGWEGADWAAMPPRIPGARSRSPRPRASSSSSCRAGASGWGRRQRPGAQNHDPEAQAARPRPPGDARCLLHGEVRADPGPVGAADGRQPEHVPGRHHELPGGTVTARIR